MDWTREGLEQAGFRGFVRFSELSDTDVPQVAGVYVVLRESVEPPEFLTASVAGHFKGRDPSALPERLADAWIDGASVLYIGKAASDSRRRRGLRKRLDEYRRYGSGERAPHWGGRYIWQLGDSANLLVAWKATPWEDAEDAESRLIADFAAVFGSKPFANRKVGRRIAAASAEE